MLKCTVSSFKRTVALTTNSIIADMLPFFSLHSSKVPCSPLHSVVAQRISTTSCDKFVSIQSQRFSSVFVYRITNFTSFLIPFCWQHRIFGCSKAMTNSHIMYWIINPIYDIFHPIEYSYFKSKSIHVSSNMHKAMSHSDKFKFPIQFLSNFDLNFDP